MPEVLVRYFAAARQAVGLSEESLDGTAGLAGILAEVSSRSDQIPPVLARCSFLVNGLATQPTSHPLPEGSTVDILPPFAGG